MGDGVTILNIKKHRNSTRQPYIKGVDTPYTDSKISHGKTGRVTLPEEFKKQLNTRGAGQTSVPRNPESQKMQNIKAIEFC